MMDYKYIREGGDYGVWGQLGTRLRLSAPSSPRSAWMDKTGVVVASGCGTGVVREGVVTNAIVSSGGRGA